MVAPGSECGGRCPGEWGTVSVHFGPLDTCQPSSAPVVGDQGGRCLRERSGRCSSNSQGCRLADEEPEEKAQTAWGEIESSGSMVSLCGSEAVVVMHVLILICTLTLLFDFCPIFPLPPSRCFCSSLGREWCWYSVFLCIVSLGREFIWCRPRYLVFLMLRIAISAVWYFDSAGGSYWSSELTSEDFCG